MRPPGGADALGALPLFHSADAATLARVAVHAGWRSFEADQVVLDFGEASTDVFLIAEGGLRVVMRTHLGQEVILGDMSAGEIFGQIAAIDNAPRSANVTALSRTRLCQMPGQVFLDAVFACPVVCHRVLRGLAGLVRLQSERLLEFAVLPVRQRLLAELLRLSRERPGDGGSPGGTGARVVSPPPPQHVLAARIGARREAVSRELSALARAGLIRTTRGAIVLADPAALRAELDGRPPGNTRAR